MKFNINDYNGKYAMLCKSKEEADDFCKYLDSVNRCWNSDKPYLNHTNWHDYGEDTCYCFNKGQYGDKEYLNKEGYTILEWSDFMNKEFSKADLKDGMMVQYRDGTHRVVVKDYLCTVKDDGIYRLNSLPYYSNDLKNLAKHSSFDIMSVYTFDDKGHCITLFDRKEPEEMTLEEVCKELGREIKIVK